MLLARRELGKFGPSWLPRKTYEAFSFCHAHFCGSPIRTLVSKLPTIHSLCSDTFESLAMNQKIERHQREHHTVDHQHQRRRVDSCDQPSARKITKR